MAIECPYCFTCRDESGVRSKLIVQNGFFIRGSDLCKIPRYRCRSCRRSFSLATGHPCYQQKKRELNPQIFELFCSGISQRRLARFLRINRKTVVNKFIFLGLWAYQALIRDRDEAPLVKEMQFDDLETFEHSKLKPLSVTMAVEKGSRRILGFRVARMPAKGHLVHRAIKKYGPRKDERSQWRKSLFRDLIPCLDPEANIGSDESPHYPRDVKKFFPKSKHQTYPGKRGCVVGQGEIKAVGYDPLFSLNHTYAMLRANINRLFRRTWNTTKKPERLALHIALYSLYHNTVLIRRS